MERLVNEGWDKEDAKLTLDAITGMKAALDTFMPHLQPTFSYHGWTITTCDHG